MATCRECLLYEKCVTRILRAISNEDIKYYKGKKIEKDFFETLEHDCVSYKPKSDYVKRERGEWKQLETDEHYWYECSICGNVPLRHQFSSTEFLSDFCPYCGADMRKEDNNA